MIPNTAVLNKAHIGTILRQSQIYWACHIVHLPDNRLPKIVFYVEMQNGKYTPGGQKKSLKDALKEFVSTLKSSLKTLT